MTATENSLSTIGQIALTVHDLEQAVPFYRDALGLPFLFEVPGMAFFDCAGVRLMLDVPEGDDHGHGGSIIYFKADDINSQHESLRSRGVEFLSEPGLTADLGDHELWMAFFSDPDGNTLALMSEVPKQT